MIEESIRGGEELRLLVTGARGFVGQALVNNCVARLPQQGSFSVRAVVRQVTTVAVPGVQYASVGDLNGQTQWQKTLVGITSVVHLAARVHVMKDTAADPLSAFRAVNVAGTLTLARQAFKLGVKRLCLRAQLA